MGPRSENRKTLLKEFKRQEVTVRAKPVRAWIAFTGRCNLDCAHCPRRSYKGKLAKGTDMPKAIFETVKDELLPFLYECKVGGNNLGEQLLVNEWGSFFKHLGNYQFDRYLVTNGLLLNGEKAAALISTGWTLDISVEGATEKTYKSIRNVDYKKIYEIISECCRVKKTLNADNSRIRLCFTAFYDNIMELPLLINKAADIGVDEIMVTHLIPLNEDQRGQSLVYHKGLYNLIYNESIELAGRSGVSLIMPDPFVIRKMNDSNGRIQSARWSERKCQHPWTSISIDEKGDVRPCCLYEDVMGNLFESKFEDIWNNRKYRKLRKRVNTGSPPRMCRNCALRGGVFTSANCNDDNSLLHMIGQGSHIDTGCFLRSKAKELIGGRSWGRQLINLARGRHQQR